MANICGMGVPRPQVLELYVEVLQSTGPAACYAWICWAFSIAHTWRARGLDGEALPKAKDEYEAVLL